MDPAIAPVTPGVALHQVHLQGGLGLNLVREVARLHGGEVTLGSHPEDGLEARWTLARGGEAEPRVGEMVGLGRIAGLV